MDTTTIKRQHRRSLSALFDIVCSENKLLKSFQLWGAVIVTAIILHYIHTANLDPLKCLNYVADLSLTILPNILGFNLGAYVLFVSLSSEKILNELSEQDETSEYSTYQHISSVFTWSILIQAFALIGAYLLSLTISLGIKSECAMCINFAVLAIMLFISLYAILLIYRVVMNVFSISQVIHCFTVISKIEKQDDK